MPPPDALGSVSVPELPEGSSSLPPSGSQSLSSRPPLALDPGEYQGTQIDFDQSTWPIVVIRFPKGDYSAEMGAFFTRILALANGPEPFVLIIDLRSASISSAGGRRESAEFVKNAIDLSRIRGAALISNARMIRGAIKAIFWLAPVPVPVCVFRDTAEAQAWAEEYDKVKPSVSVEVAGGGSSVGIKDLVQGTVDIANWIDDNFGGS